MMLPWPPVMVVPPMIAPPMASSSRPAPVPGATEEEKVAE